MRIKINLGLVVLLVFCSAICAFAQSNAVNNQKIIAQTDEYLNQLVKQDRFSGEVLLARNGKIVLSKGYGLANRETKTINTPQTKIRLGSVSKQFTAVAILM